MILAAFCYPDPFHEKRVPADQNETDPDPDPKQ